MNKKEAKKILCKEISRLRDKKYTELVKIINKVITKEIIGESGKKYQIEIQAFWDDKTNENLRVLVSIDDGGWRAFSPLTSDFIIGPQNIFIGE